MAQVRLILREDVYGLGDAGKLVAVKPGYARNFLLPQGKAELATEARVKAFDHQKRVISDKLAKELKDVEALKNKIEGLSLSFEVLAGEGGRLFGSVTNAQIAAQLAEKGVVVDRRKIQIKQPIKTVGEHEVALKIQGELHATVKLEVTASSEAPPAEAEEVEIPEETSDESPDDIDAEQDDPEDDDDPKEDD